MVANHLIGKKDFETSIGSSSAMNESEEEPMLRRQHASSVDSFQGHKYETSSLLISEDNHFPKEQKNKKWSTDVKHRKNYNSYIAPRNITFLCCIGIFAIVLHTSTQSGSDIPKVVSINVTDNDENPISSFGADEGNKEISIQTTKDSVSSVNHPDINTAIVESSDLYDEYEDDGELPYSTVGTPSTQKTNGIMTKDENNNNIEISTDKESTHMDEHPGMDKNAATTTTTKGNNVITDQESHTSTPITAPSSSPPTKPTCRKNYFYEKAKVYAENYLQNVGAIDPFGGFLLRDISRPVKRHISSQQQKSTSEKVMQVPRAVYTFTNKIQNTNFETHMGQLARLVVYALCSDGVVLVPNFIKSQLDRYNANWVLENYFPIFYTYESFHSTYTEYLKPEVSAGHLDAKKLKKLFPSVQKLDSYMVKDMPHCTRPVNNDNLNENLDKQQQDTGLINNYSDSPLMHAIVETETAIWSSLMSSPTVQLQTWVDQTLCDGVLSGVVDVDQASSSSNNNVTESSTTTKKVVMDERLLIAGVQANWKQGECVHKCKQTIWETFPSDSLAFQEITLELQAMKDKANTVVPASIDELRQKALEELETQKLEASSSLTDSTSNTTAAQSNHTRLRRRTLFEEDLLNHTSPKVTTVVDTSLSQNSNYSMTTGKNSCSIQAYEVPAPNKVHKHESDTEEAGESTNARTTLEKEDCEIPSEIPALAWPATLKHCPFCWMQADYVKQQIQRYEGNSSMSMFVATDSNDAQMVAQTVAELYPDVFPSSSTNTLAGGTPTLLGPVKSSHAKFRLAFEMQLLAVCDILVYSPVSYTGRVVARVRQAIGYHPFPQARDDSQHKGKDAFYFHKSTFPFSS